MLKVYVIEKCLLEASWGSLVLVLCQHRIGAWNLDLFEATFTSGDEFGSHNELTFELGSCNVHTVVDFEL